MVLGWLELSGKGKVRWSVRRGEVGLFPQSVHHGAHARPKPTKNKLFLSAGVPESTS